MTYKEIFSFKNLLKAHNKTKRSKLYKKQVCEFELNKSNELYKLYEELQKKTYKISPYNTFKIYEPKERRVDATSYRDRVVQNCFVDNYLFPILEKHLIYDNAACRKNKGTDFARNRLKEFLVECNKKYGNNFYVFTYDIHHYFESIDHDVLKKKMKYIIKDLEIYEFICMIIDSFNKEENKGLPLGNQSSQCFALYYLDSFDRIIKEKYSIKYYSRYMDDGVILSNDQDKLKNLLNDLKLELNKLNITFNETKTMIFPIKQGITYLGFRYRISSYNKILVSMAKKKKKRLIHYIHRYELKCESLFSYRNYIRLRTNCNNNLIKYIDKEISSIKN